MQIQWNEMKWCTNSVVAKTVDDAGECSVPADDDGRIIDGLQKDWTLDCTTREDGQKNGWWDEMKRGQNKTRKQNKK